MSLTIGSLCSGYGGLDLAVKEVFSDASVAWFCDNDPAVDKVYRANFPEVETNLGDIKEVDWSTVQPVDVVTAGYPCQPFSQAGKRGDWENDERHLWPHVYTAINVLGPRYAVLENVPGHYNRGLPEVLGALAEAGFDAEWRSLRASDVKAPHQRNRLFALAYPNGERQQRPFEISRGGGLISELLLTPTSNLSTNGGPRHPEERKAGGHGPTLDDQLTFLGCSPPSRGT